MLELVDIGLRRADFELSLQQLAFAPGQMSALVGASGSGKSTLLDIVGGFARPDLGDVRWNGQSIANLPAWRRPVATLFQSDNLFEHLSVYANVALGLSTRLRLNGGQRQQVIDALAEVGLAGREGSYPDALSGGQRQRVAIARTFVQQRPILLLDEPFASLGPGQRREMIEWVYHSSYKRNCVVVLTTHQPEDLSGLPHQLAFLEAGKLLFCGDGTDLLDNPPPPLRRYLGRQSD